MGAVEAGEDAEAAEAAEAAAFIRIIQTRRDLIR